MLSGTLSLPKGVAEVSEVEVSGAILPLLTAFAIISVQKKIVKGENYGNG